MTLAGTELRKPKDCYAFERSMRKLMECALTDPNTQLNGRSGQRQHGVDIYGYRNWFVQHRRAWFIGHSLGDPDWDSLVLEYKAILGKAA